MAHQTQLRSGISSTGTSRNDDLLNLGTSYARGPKFGCRGPFHPSMDRNNLDDEKGETRLYIGNLDQRITESHLIKMFSPFGKIVSEDFLWHTRGPKRGEPRGFAFIQFSTKEEALQAKEKMNGRLACGRPLVVRLATEKYLIEATNPPQAVGDAGKSIVASGPSGQMNRSAKIAAIKNKLKAMEEESCSSKKPRSI
ncbi:uncharacterized protein LOC131249100 [Magnolia sinica]|uniref:uncharacterized protein LOC131249100 n=1 Tax=Magnolia sinica TaxID=86752 RepID=UPI00265ADCFD|nr:uncharacterized protein LOC131249100 [Magnolia sinica]